MHVLHTYHNEDEKYMLLTVNNQMFGDNGNSWYWAA